MTKSWIRGWRSGALTAGLVLSAGVLSGGCAPATRAVSHLGGTPGQAASSQGPAGPSRGQAGQGAAPPAAAATTPATRPPSPSGPGSAGPSPGAAKTVVPPAASGSGQPQPASIASLATAQDQAAIDRSLTQIESGLAGVDQATSSGETDVPSN